MTSLAHGLALAVALAAAPLSAATLYTDAGDFAAAAGSTSFDDFEGSTFDGTTIVFSAGTITCSGGSFCGSFFGNEFGSGLALSGTKAPFFGTPDTLLFSFSDPVTAFGIYIGGSGDVGVQNLVLTLSDGTSFTPFPDYTNASGTFVGNTLFAGVVSPTAFTSFSVTGAPIGDGVFFDDASIGFAGGVIPEPATWAMMILGFGLVGMAARRRPGIATA